MKPIFSPTILFLSPPNSIPFQFLLPFGNLTRFQILSLSLFWNKYQYGGMMIWCPFIFLSFYYLVQETCRGTKIWIRVLWGCWIQSFLPSRISISKNLEDQRPSRNQGCHFGKNLWKRTVELVFWIVSLVGLSWFSGWLIGSLACLFFFCLFLELSFSLPPSFPLFT